MKFLFYNAFILENAKTSKIIDTSTALRKANVCHSMCNGFDDHMLSVIDTEQEDHYQILVTMEDCFQCSREFG